MKLTAIVQKIEDLKSELDDLRPLKSNDEKRLWKKLRLEWNYNSNHIEGNTLTYGETALLLFREKIGNEKVHELREIEEMKAHDVAVHLIKEWAEDKERPIIEQDIKNLNKIILVRPFWKEALTEDRQSTRRLIEVGNYKKFPNSVLLSNGEMFYYTAPEDVSYEMEKLMQWYRKEDNDLHTVEKAAILHYRFVRIHPFDDGNGRVARLLLNYELMRNGYPPIIIKSADKKNYLDALSQADNENMTAFIEYIAEQTFYTLEMSIKAAKGESIEEMDDIDKEIALFKKELQRSKTVEKVYSLENSLEIFKKSIIPLDYQIQQKLNKFKDLFSRNHEWFEFGSHSVSSIELILETKEKFSDFRRGIVYRGFLQNGVNTFETSVFYHINFLNYQYQFKINDEIIYEKLYTEQLTASEMTEITNQIAKSILKDIKSKIKK